MEGKLTLQGNDICSQKEFHSNGRKRNSLGISSASYSNIVATIHGNLELPDPKAYATELVRRWNAFEEGGLVGDLVGACKTAEKELEQRYKANQGSAIDKLVLKILKAAIAKAKGSS